MAADKERVCVTGAGGFLGSWVVKLLLSKDYLVHGTIRDPTDGKYAYLKNLEMATENLKLFQADLLDYSSLFHAIQGCRGVFHVASPVPSTTVENPEVLTEPAVKGTLNVLEACAEAKVKRVVIVSSLAAVAMNPTKWHEGAVIDESWCSIGECYRSAKNWYGLSKTEAEREAWEYAKSSGLDLVAVCPALILGPLLHSTANASSLKLIELLKEGYESMENQPQYVVDVRDVAEALLLAHEMPEAEGRYICSAHEIKTKDLVEKLRSLYPCSYSHPKSFSETEGLHLKISSEKLQKLGWSYCSLEDTLVDSVESYRKAGILE